jgi:hypothetical protein
LTNEKARAGAQTERQPIAREEWLNEKAYMLKIERAVALKTGWRMGPYLRWFPRSVMVAEG